MIFEGVFALLALERYNYGPSQVGSVLVMAGIIGVVMQGALSGPLMRKLGEATVIKLSMLASAIAFVLMLWPTHSWGVMLTVGFYVVSNSLLRPAITAYISKRAPGGQGEAMGLSNSFMGFGRILGPILGGFLYDIEWSQPYRWGAGIMFIGFITSLIWLKEKKSPVASPTK
jgi:DHA1 family multidrug resistance protein-like MFS transporter